MRVIHAASAADFLKTAESVQAIYNRVWDDLIESDDHIVVDLCDMSETTRDFLLGLVLCIRDETRSTVALKTKHARQLKQLADLSAEANIHLTVFTPEGRTTLSPEDPAHPQIEPRWTDPLAWRRDHPLMNEELLWAAPALGEATGGNMTKLRRRHAVARLYCARAEWTWHIAETDEKNGLCFGLVDGNELAWGLFDLDQLARATLPGSSVPAVRRDLLYTPEPLGEIYDRLSAQRNARPGHFPEDDPHYPGMPICPGCGGPDDAHYPGCLPANHQRAARRP